MSSHSNHMQALGASGLLFSLSLGLIFGGELIHEVSSSPEYILIGRLVQGGGVLFLAALFPAVYASIVPIKSSSNDGKWGAHRILFHALSWLILLVSCVMSFSLALWWKFICVQAWGLLPSVSSLIFLSIVFLISSLASDDDLDLQSAVKFVSIASTKLSLFFSANVLLVISAAVLGILAEINWINRKNSRVGLIEAVLSISFIITALFNTHGLGGRLLKHKGWVFYNPFVGGIKFVVLQFFSWLFFSISVILGIAFIISFYTVGLELFVGVTAISGTLCLLSEGLMILSLYSYEETTPLNKDQSPLSSNVHRLHTFFITVLMVNIQYIPFVSLYPLFLISGLPFSEAILHWWSASVCISLYTIVYLYFKTNDLTKAGDASPRVLYHIIRSTCLRLLQFLPAGITVAMSVNSSLTTTIPWSIISTLHIFYIYYTYNDHPETTGCRELKTGEFLSSLMMYLDTSVQSYFNGKVIKSVELDPESLYVFGFHPHGVIPVSLFWLRNSNSWKQLFPGVLFSTLTASSLHLVPIMRDLLQWKGGREVSRLSFESTLRSGRNVLVVPGGQTELMLSTSHEKQVRITIKHQGFIKLAIQEGANLVPVFSFGENDVLENVQLPSMQRWFLKRLGAAIPFHPHSDFYLPIPRRNNISVVVGKPILVKHIAHPDEEDVRKVFNAYLTELMRIFEKHKNACYQMEGRELLFIDSKGEVYRVPQETHSLDTVSELHHKSK